MKIFLGPGQIRVCLERTFRLAEGQSHVPAPSVCGFTRQSIVGWKLNIILFVEFFLAIWMNRYVQGLYS